MNTKNVLLVVFFLVAVGLALGAFAQFDTPVIKEWTKTEVNDKGEEEVVDYMTIDGIMVHDGSRNSPSRLLYSPARKHAGNAASALGRHRTL